MKLEKSLFRLECITRQNVETGFAFQCENCGRAIVNLAHIVHITTSAKHIVGTECAKTLCAGDAEEIEKLEKWLPKEKVEKYLAMQNFGVYFKKGFGDWINVYQTRRNKEGQNIEALLDSFKAKDFPSKLLR